MRTGAAIAGLVLVAGCGSSCSASDSGGSPASADTPVGNSAAPFPSDQYSERDVRRHLGLVDDSGLVFYRADGLDCEVAVVLTSPQQVSTYADAGDVVATDPQQRVGVKLVAEPQRPCFDAVTAALADFDT